MAVVVAAQVGKDVTFGRDVDNACGRGRDAVWLKFMHARSFVCVFCQCTSFAFVLPLVVKKKDN